MMRLLKIKTNTPIRTKLEDPRTDQFRAAVIAACKENKQKVGEDAMRWINFRPPPPYAALPRVIYAQPGLNRNVAGIYVYDNSLGLLEKIEDSLRRKGRIRVGDQEVRIVDMEIRNDLPFLPVRKEETIRYRTITPMVLFDKTKEHGVYHAITKKHKESDPERFKKEMKDLIAGMMRKSIRGQLIQRAGKESPDFVDRIDIDIEDFAIRHGKYHPDQPKTPFVFMAFRSTWELPIFIGHHTGKGFGMIRGTKGGRA
jgi:hypothetical protein